MSSPSSSTAKCIQTLLDAGAEVLGVTKLSSFISKKEPTQAVDYSAPFNPRADGYQSPAGSSSGSAAALAAYPWLDFAIGTDTSGSGRRPALVNGCFQLRPTHDRISLEGIAPSFSPFDTPCVFSRDVTWLTKFAKVWYAGQTDPVDSAGHIPKAIIYPLDYFPVSTSEQMQLLDAFVAQMAEYTGVTPTRLSISDYWQQNPPREAGGESVEEYLKDVIIHTYYRDFYRSTSEFRARYHEKHHKSPYVNEFIRWRWSLGKPVTDTQCDEGIMRLDVYRNWLLNEVMKPTEQFAFFVLPIANVEPTYRDLTPPASDAPTGFDQLFVSPIMGTPDLVVPIEHVPYISRITEVEEYLPVA